MFNNVVQFLGAFVLLWVSSGIVVSSVTKIAHSLHMSTFIVSFFILGGFTSITEIMVGVNAHINNEPEIFVGNLVGSSVVVFLLIIPFMAVVGKGITLNHSLSTKDLVTAVLIVGMPALLTLDNSISYVDAIICIVLYVYFVIMEGRKSKTLDKIAHVRISHSTLLTSLGKILVAVMVVFISTNVLVEKTEAIGSALQISPFIISLIIISLGTNIPEFTIAIRAILSKTNSVAFGSYIGSASLNTFELGVLSLIGTTPIAAEGSNYSVLVFLGGLGLFVAFGRRKKDISSKEGLALILCYVLFVVCEILTGPGWGLRY